MKEQKYIIEIFKRKGDVEKGRPMTLIEIFEKVIFEIENKDVDWDYATDYVEKVKISEVDE